MTGWRLLVTASNLLAAVAGGPRAAGEGRGAGGGRGPHPEPPGRVRGTCVDAMMGADDSGGDSDDHSDDDSGGDSDHDWGDTDAAGRGRAADGNGRGG